jgi:endogenous inhibitor of DNA gyrase (YacG/DUF329 family)
MSITVICPRCQRPVQLPDRPGQRRVECAECGDSFDASAALRRPAARSQALLKKDLLQVPVLGSFLLVVGWLLMVLLIISILFFPLFHIVWLLGGWGEEKKNVPPRA